MEDIYIIFVIALIFGLAIFLNYITFNNLGCFLAWLLLLDCFFVWSTLMPLWSLILLIIINISYLGIKKFKERGFE